MTPDDLLGLTMVSSEPLGNTELFHSFSFLKFVIFVEIGRKNDFDDTHASYNVCDVFDSAHCDIAKNWLDLINAL